MIVSYLLLMLLIISTLGENCDDILCAHVFDYVCGVAELRDGTQIIMKYQNICYMRKEACELDNIVLDICQVPDEMCNIKKKKKTQNNYQGEGRRVNDFSIIGAHQACNHTCPTFCTDAYDPACAQIWKRNSYSSTYRPMINHCHIDLFSCTAGVNVTIQPLGKCYTNPSGLLFMQHMAAMKSLQLLDESVVISKLKPQETRRATNIEEELNLKEQLLEVVRRIFNKHRFI